MSKIAFKPEQQAVIDCKGKNQLVSASAGSGKTTIMIQKIINLITLDKISIKNILVLTYTKASAEEMKQKLVGAIYEEVKNDPNLLKQIDQVETADISTIHSFFQKTITKYFMKLGIDPSFEIIDETKGIKLQRIAMQNAIEIFTKNNKNAMDELLNFYAPSRNTEDIEKIVSDLNTFMLALPNKEEWCQTKALSVYENLDENLALSVLNQEVFFATQHCISVLKQLQAISASYGEDGYVKFINAYLSILEDVKAEADRFFDNCALWCNLPKGLRLKESADLPHVYEKLIQTRELIKDYSNSLKKWVFIDKEVAEIQLNAIKPIAKSFLDLTLLFQEQYAKEKQRENVLDYDDLEKFMLKLIENKEVCDEIRAGYEKIFVDEYQDANRVQEKIIKALSKDNNRFMVGDVKQSIYGFRQAEPDIFLETLEKFSGEEKSEVGFLNYNFRSHSLILNFVNIVFSKIMTPKTSKIDYLDTSMFKWNEGTYLPVEDQSFPHVEIDVLLRPEKQPKPVPKKIYSVLDEFEGEQAKSDAFLEAIFIANKIEEILGKKIYVAKQKREKAIEYKDITILLRSRVGYLDDFSSVITALGIPLYASVSNSLFDDGDVELLLNVLKLVVNPNNDIALVAVMHSVFGEFTFDELARIRLEGAPRQTFYECVKTFNGDEKIKAKILKFKEFLKNFAFHIQHFGHYKAFSVFMEKYGFYEYLLLKNEGIQKKTWVQKFVDNFLSNGFFSDTQGFLEFVENNRKKIKAPSYSGGENCVNVTTMHSSKGLEYPVVIVANANQNFDLMKSSTDIKLNQNLGIGLKYYNLETREKQESLPFVAIQKFTRNNEFAEKMRLLYVALTRPQNHLIVVGTAKKLEFTPLNSDFQTLKQHSFLSLLIGALNEEEIEKVCAGENVCSENYSVNVISPKVIEEPMHTRAENKSEVDFEIAKTMQEYLDFVPQKTLLQTHASVTALRQKFEDVEFGSGEENSMQNASIGTFYHLVLEKMDFNKISSPQDVETFLSTLKSEEIALVDANKIWQAIKLIKNFGAEKYLKEIPFSMNLSLASLDKSLPSEKTFVHGIIDLVCLGQENVLIDYKYTEEQDTKKIIEKYKLQLELYAKALDLTGQVKINKKYLLLIKQGEIVEVK